MLTDLLGPNASPPHGVSRPPFTSPQEGSATILIVDDEELNLDMLSRRLRRSGYTVEVAASGQSALDAVARGSFDLVLLDQMMPGMSGAEVLRIWREEHTPQQLPVVMVTAVAESDRIAAALEAGANDYITKPIDFQVALARIRVQLSRARAEQALRRSEERYALAARASRDGLWDWNLVTDQIYYSPRWMEMLGLREVEPNAENWLARVLPADRPLVEEAIRRCGMEGDETFQCSYRMLNSSGNLRWMSCRAVMTRDAEGRPVRLAGSQSDVTEERTRDPLTGLSNRLYILGHLERALRCESDEQCAVLLLDLDKFKTINDSLGHLAGDELIRQFAARLRAVVADPASTLLRPICSRLGGDEFAILLQQSASREATALFVERLQEIMRAPFPVAERMLHCAFSVGIAWLDSATDGRCAPERLLENADAALYAAKARGRGEVAFFDPALAQVAVERFELENDLRLALERSEFTIVYQAKSDLATGRAYGVEALVRWQHPTRGLLPPAAFISVAEETGQIVEIGRWVLEQACRQVRAWHLTLPSEPPLQLSVNLSPAEFKQDHLIERIAEVLSLTGFPPTLLHLEITESVLIEELDSARDLLCSLKALGIQLELDDFGTGYSSLKYLRELPFDALKIDRHFTLALSPEKPGSDRLVKAIVSMAESLGLSVIAEGIETEPQNAALRQLGCKRGQGYFFSKPIGAESMEALLSDQFSAAKQGTPAALSGALL